MSFGYKSQDLQAEMQKRKDSNSLIFGVMKVQVIRWLLWLPLLFFLAVSAATPRVTGSWRSDNSREDADPSWKTPWGNQLPDMLVAYYRHHGVHSLMLVVCHTDIGELTLCMQCAFRSNL